MHAALLRVFRRFPRVFIVVAAVAALASARFAILSSVEDSMNNVDASLDAPPGCSSDMTCPAGWEVKHGTDD